MNSWKNCFTNPEDRILEESKKIISGRWVIPVHVVPVLKFMLISEMMKKERKIPGHTLVNNGIRR